MARQQAVLPVPEVSSAPKRRVAIFRTDLLPISETFIRDQAAALRTYQPILVGRRELAGGLPTPGLPRELVPAARGRFASAWRFWLQRPDPDLVTALASLQADLVHVHFGTDAVDVWPSVKAAGLPMLVTLHGYDINIDRHWWEAGHDGLRRRLYPRRLLSMASDPAVTFAAVSEAIRQRAIAYGIPDWKIFTSYIGVDTQRFRPGGLPIERRRKRILFVGRMVQKKAPLLMIEAFAQVRKSIPDAELAMIGDGPLLARARELAGDLAVPVSFCGAMSWEEVLQALHEARVFCLPSVTAANGDAEGLPLVVLEAQAAGVPVVTSARGAVREGMVDGATGTVCGEGALHSLVEGLCMFLCNDTAVRKASSAAIDFVQAEFDVRSCSRLLEDLYERRRA